MEEDGGGLGREKKKMKRKVARVLDNEEEGKKDWTFLLTFLSLFLFSSQLSVCSAP